jgi:hypothetical protein
MIWPSYWGRMNKEGAIRPMLPAEVSSVISEKSLIPDQTTDEQIRDPYDTRPLTNDQIRKILAALGEDKTKEEPVFVTAGRLYRVSGSPDSRGPWEHQAAAPYAWAFGHDVRPAKQALGARGCTDCHSSDSPIFFGQVVARGAVTAGASATMWELRDKDATLAKLFAFSFTFRPMLKYIVFPCAAIVAGVLLYYGLMGLGGIAGRRRNRRIDA